MLRKITCYTADKALSIEFTMTRYGTNYTWLNRMSVVLPGWGLGSPPNALNSPPSGQHKNMDDISISVTTHSIR